MKARAVAAFALRTALLASLLFWLSRGLDWARMRELAGILRRHPAEIGRALACTCLALCCGSLRWWALLRALGYSRVGPATATRWVWIGQFFNAFLPGACGGDFMRAWIVVKHHGPGERAAAAASVLIDRLYGLWFLLVIAGGGLLARPLWQTGDAAWSAAALLILPLALASLIAPALVFLLPLGLSQKAHARLGDVHQAFRTCLRAPTASLLALLGSAGNYLFLALAAGAFAEAIEASIPLANMLLLFPVITVLASVPLTPGALGLRENLFAMLGPALGLPAEQAVLASLLLYASGLAVGLLGGVFFLCGERPPRSPTEAAS